MLTEPKILMLSSDPQESSVLEQLLKHYASLGVASSLLELEACVERDDYDAVLCGWSFHQGNWEGAMKGVHQWCPDLPVVIFCGQGGECEWADVLQAGAFDLLSAPYERNAVLPALEHAMVSCEARRSHRSRNLISAAS